MIKRLLALTILGVMLSGCYMVPMAFVGPAVSGFSTTSLISSGVGIAIKHETGKTIYEHAFGTLGAGIEQSYFPRNNKTRFVKKYPNRLK